jgi:phosphoglycolate phosphatase
VRFSLIVFDLDGTLVDSLRDLAESANATLVECGVAPLEKEALARMVGDGAAALVARAFAAAGHRPPRDALSRFLAVYNSRLLSCTRPYPGVDQLLTALDRRVKRAVLTNKPIDPTRHILDGLDLARHFPAGRVIGGDGPFPRKPDPGALRWLASVEGVALDRTILVGDSVVDWRTARAANTHICLARYGFGYEGFPLAQLGRDEYVIDAPSELLAVL